MLKLQIWDTAGQERFRSITQSYYRSAHALVLVYDISTQSTFQSLPVWIKEIEQYANPKVLKALVGNKVDRDDRMVPSFEGEEFARLNNMYFIETSAKEAENVEKLFTEIAMMLTKEAKVNSQRYNGKSHLDSIPKYLNTVESHEHNCCKYS